MVVHKLNIFQNHRWLRWVWVVGLLAWILPASSHITIAEERTTSGETESQNILSPMWGVNISQWSQEIDVISKKYGIHPDLIAAVTLEESHGLPHVESYVGAVGLMGIMPSGPGLEWRPSSEALRNPDLNLDWGGAILSDILQQSGGDISAALAAYNGGWAQVNKLIPQNYAADVLDNYAQALMIREGIDPSFALRWTIAVELQQGNIATEPLIMGQQPVSGLHTYGEHIMFHHVDESGRSYRIKAYAVPLVVVQELNKDEVLFESSDMLNALLQNHLDRDKKNLNTNPQVILTCLSSLNRLRGRVSTRWFAPSSCPSWHR